MRELNTLSLFDGKSCGMVALERAGIKVGAYIASEVDKYAIEISKKNYPNIIHVGDVKNVHYTNLGVEIDQEISMRVIGVKIDLLIGGSPCQGFSFAGRQLNFEDERSKLFFEYVRLLKEIRLTNPDVLFLLENVNMKQEYQDIISNLLGVKPIDINSELVSAQKRRRLYWTNIPGVTKPKDKGILLENIIDNGFVDKDKSYCIDANYFKGTNASQYICKSRRQVVWVIPEATKKGFIEVSNGQFIDLTFIKSKTRRGRLMIEKSNCLTASPYNYCMVTNDWFRKLTPLECERLQTLPDNYTEGVSDAQRYKMLGNGWTIDIISHIFSFIK